MQPCVQHLLPLLILSLAPLFSLLSLSLAPAVIEPGTNTTTEAPADGFRYFQTQCVAYSFQVSIELTNIVGNCYLYGSTVVSNPGPVFNNSVVIRDERDNTKIQTVYVTVQPSESNVCEFISSHYLTYTVLSLF